MQLAHRVAAQVASLCQLRLLTLHRELKTASQKSKGRARGRRPRAGNQGLLAMMTWTPAVRLWSTWQHATPGAAAAPCPRPQYVRGGCLQHSLCRQPACRVSARKLHLHLPRTMRTDNAALESLAVRAYHAVRLDSSDQAAVLASGTVGWRPEISWFVLIRATQHFVPWPTPRLGGPTQVSISCVRVLSGAPG